MNLRMSDFVHFVEGDDGLVALYNALTLGVMIVDKETAERLRNFENGIVPSSVVEQIRSKHGGEKLIQKLKKHKLAFSPEERPDLQDYERIQAELSTKRIGILYLLTTDVCNLDCSYCFVEGGIPEDYDFTKMDTATAYEGLDLFAEALSDSEGVEEPQVIFYGGEPFLNFEVMRDAFDYIEELKDAGRLPRNTSITINTNGTLIDEKIASELSQVKNLNLAISLDGPREVHNECRRYHEGGGSYDDIMESYELLREEGVGVGFCCTISRYNVDNLEEIARWFVEEMDAESMGFNIMIDTEQSKPERGELEGYAEKTSRKIINCFEYFRERGIYEDRIMRKVKAFTEGNIYYRDCAGCGEQLVVSPDEMVGVCQGYCGSKDNFVELSKDLDPLNHPLWERWRHRSPLYMPQCRDCIALSVCGGGCPFSADNNYGSIWELDQGFCVHAKTTVKYLLKDLISNVQT